METQQQTTTAPPKPIKPGKGAKRKARYQAYTARATFLTCKKVFRSPSKRQAHVESGHKDMTGVNPNRQVKAN